MMPLTPEERKTREDQGEAHVRYEVATNGFNSPERDRDREWLAELHVTRRKADEAFQAEQMQLTKHTDKVTRYTLFGTWIGAVAAVIAAVVGTISMIALLHQMRHQR
jgi:hypothetical protein